MHTMHMLKQSEVVVQPSQFQKLCDNGRSQNDNIDFSSLSVRPYVLSSHYTRPVTQLLHWFTNCWQNSDGKFQNENEL